jgi:hypothetical protein
LFTCTPTSGSVQIQTAAGYPGTVAKPTANRVIMPEAHDICVQDVQSEDNDLDNTFQRQIPFFPVLLFSWTPQKKILQFQERLPAGKTLPTISKLCNNTQQ